MRQAQFYFHGDLRFFIPPEDQDTWISQTFNVGQTVKHLIESIGPPHVEVARITVGESQKTWSYQVQNGNRVQVYPHVPGEESPLVPNPKQPYRFILDGHLGRLAQHMRLMGLDALYRNDYGDEDLAQIASDQERILLTRDRGLLKRKILIWGRCIRSMEPEQQMLEVMQRFQLWQQVKPFSRCSRCNGLLQPVTKEQVLHLLEPLTKIHYYEFLQCAQCGQVYWEGSHMSKLHRFVDRIMSQSQSNPDRS